MITIEINTPVLKAALENPGKNFLVVFGNHSRRCHMFQMAIQDVVTQLAMMPIMISKSQYMLTMPEGGRVWFKSVQYNHDVYALQGLIYHDFFIDESCETINYPLWNLMYAHLLAGKRQ